MDTMISFANNGLADHFLTKDELRKSCPAAFKTEPTNPKVSNRYVHANTETVVDDLEKLGWSCSGKAMPYKQKIFRCKKPSYDCFSKS